MYFFFFVIIPPGKRWVLHLYILESPLPKDALCQVWFKLAQWFWRRRFFNFYNVFFAFCQLSPLGKGQGPLFEQNWIPFIQGYFVPSLVATGPVVLEKKWKIGKVYRQTDRRRTKGDQKHTWAFSSGELKTEQHTFFYESLGLHK